MPGLSGKPDGYDDILTLNQGFKGYSLRRHLGDSHFFLHHPFFSVIYFLRYPEFVITRSQPT